SRWHPPSSGPPTPATASPTPPCTSTAAWASTWTTRHTAISSPPNETSSPSAAPQHNCAESARYSPQLRSDALTSPTVRPHRYVGLQGELRMTVSSPEAEPPETDPGSGRSP